MQLGVDVRRRGVGDGPDFFQRGGRHAPGISTARAILQIAAKHTLAAAAAPRLLGCLCDGSMKRSTNALIRPPINAPSPSKQNAPGRSINRLIQQPLLPYPNPTHHHTHHSMEPLYGHEGETAAAAGAAAADVYQPPQSSADGSFRCVCGWERWVELLDGCCRHAAPVSSSRPCLAD